MEHSYRRMELYAGLGGPKAFGSAREVMEVPALDEVDCLCEECINARVREARAWARGVLDALDG